MKNIVVITGSPRKNGNSERLANAFIKGAAENGHQLTKIASADLHIQGCRACGGCYSKGKACVFDDDFNKLAPVIEDADVIVFATPLYWFTFPAQIKSLIDRFYALLRGPKPLKDGKECALLVCGGDKPDAFAGILKSYEIMTAYLRWQDRGVVLAEEVNEKGAIEGHPALKAAEELGRKI